MDEFTLTDARLEVLETLRRSDWEAIPLDGNATRILIADTESGTTWIVTVQPAGLPGDTEPDAIADPDDVEPEEGDRTHAPGCSQHPDHAGPCTVTARTYHEPGCTEHHPPDLHCRDAAGHDLTIPF